MEKDLMVFTNNKFGNVRVVIKDDEPYFVGIDVAKCLGYADPSSAVSKKCKHGVKTLIDIIVDQPCQYGNLPNRRQLTVIPEGDVYKLVFGSDLPNAIEFQDWVCDEVLPSIRKKGYYSVAPVQDERASLLMSIIDAPDDVSTALAVKKYTDHVTAPLKEEIKELTPKAEFHDAVTKSDDLLTMKEVADILAIKGYGRNKVFALLRFKKIFNDDNQPYRKYIDQGYFVPKENKSTTRYGTVKINVTTYVTQKGLDFIRKLIIKDIQDKEAD